MMDSMINNSLLVNRADRRLVFKLMIHYKIFHLQLKNRINHPSSKRLKIRIENLSEHVEMEDQTEKSKRNR